jgi:hypothetical protein
MIIKLYKVISLDKLIYNYYSTKILIDFISYILNKIKMSRQTFIPVIESQIIGEYEKVEDAVETIIRYLMKNEIIDFQNYYEDILPSTLNDKIYCKHCYSYPCEDEVPNCNCKDCKYAKNLDTCENCKKMNDFNQYIWNNKSKLIGNNYESNKFINKFVQFIINQYDWNNHSEINDNLQKLFKEFTYDVDEVSITIKIKN